MSVGSIGTPSNLSIYQTNTAPLPGGPAPARSPQGTVVPPAPGASTGGANLNLRGAPQGQAPADPAASADAFSSALSQLPAAGNTLDFLARLMIEQAADQRKQALSDRLATREMAKAELLAQAGTLQDQASELMKGAITSLVLTAVSSAVTIGMSAASVALSGVSLGKLAQGGKGMSDAAVAGAKSFSGLGESISQFSSAAGSLGQGGAGAASSITQSNAKQEEADGAVHAAKAQEQQSLGELRKSAEDALTETMKQLIQFLKDMADSKAEQMRAMTRV